MATVESAQISVGFFYCIIENFENRHLRLGDGCLEALTDYRPRCNFKLVPLNAKIAK